MPRLIDLYKQDLRNTSNTHVRQNARRYWLRAVIETLHTRALTTMPVPRRSTNKDYVQRWEPFWNVRPDDELYELLDYLAPYFKRAENRGTKL